jgi:hypothetical protein
MARPSPTPTASSRATVSAAERRTVTFMAIRQAKAAINQTMAQFSDKLRPR